MITKTPGVCGGEACVQNTRIPVWILWSLHQQGESDAFILTNYPSLNVQDLASAYTYAEEHAQEIAAAIKDNEEA